MTHLVLLPGTLCDEHLLAHQTRHLADIASVEVGDLTTADTVSGMETAVFDRALPHGATCWTRFSTTRRRSRRRWFSSRPSRRAPRSYLAMGLN